MIKILVLAGTRPEAIKMVPVIWGLRAMSDIFTVRVCATGQHRQMLDQAFADFSISPDVDLDVMRPDQTLASLSGRLFPAIDQLLEREKPAAVLVQGDTTTVQVAALCAFYRGIPVGHVEAGLRSHDLRAPFPEEMNRKVASLAATWHFAPTELAKRNLIEEGIPDEAVFVTGNTVIDSLLWMAEEVRRDPPPLPPALEDAVESRRPMVLITGHRRESFGEGFSNICRALRRLAEHHPETAFVYPVHLNPNVRRVVMDRLSGVSNIHLAEPLSYRGFVRLMAASRLLLTDSGGIQEEGPSLRKPVLIMRAVTERPEGVDAGVNLLVGTDPDAIFTNVDRLLSDTREYELISSIQNPYGDGAAGSRIAGILREVLQGSDLSCLGAV